MRNLSRSIAAVALVALVAVALSPAAGIGAPARAEDTVPITSLIENMQKYDDHVVTIQGEAIGDFMVRGVNAWITVNDDAYSKSSIEEGGELVGMSNAGIGVWVPEQTGRKIGIFGGWKNKGAIVRLTGVFHRACSEHGGDTDIHADSLEVVAPGRPFSKPFKWAELIAIIILCGAIAVLWNVRRGRRAKAKREE
jgi:hypothetical protein